MSNRQVRLLLHPGRADELVLRDETPAPETPIAIFADGTPTTRVHERSLLRALRPHPRPDIDEQLRARLEVLS